jgi:hypothetical protein
MNKIDKRSPSVVLTLIMVGLSLIVLPSCDEPDYFLKCQETVGRRPCMKGSMRYDSHRRECACKTAHRGEIKWDVPKKR